MQTSPRPAPEARSELPMPPVQVFFSSPKYLPMLPELPAGITEMPYSDHAPNVMLDFPTGWALPMLDGWHSGWRRRTVVFTGNANETYGDVLRSYHVGGVVTTSEEPYMLLAALDTLKTTRVTGHTWMQLRVLRRLLMGRSNTEIAEELSISPKTVTNHIGPLLAAHGCPTRTELVACILTGARRG